MEKIIYLGMENTPHTVYETAFVRNGRVMYQYENDKGRPVMLEATQNNPAYYPPSDYRQYPNNMEPACIAGKKYPIDILNRGYSGHYFKLVETTT